MSATLERIPTTTADGERLRFRSPSAGKLVWKSWGEMDLAEQEFVREQYPSFAPRLEPGTGRYANDIAYFTMRLQAADEVVRTGRDGPERGRAIGARHQYREAIRLYQDAELIPDDADVWFAVVPGDMTTYMPPVLDRTLDDYMPDHYVKTYNHVARLSDPVAIAWMRRMVMRPDLVSNQAIYEKPIGSYPFIDRDSGELIAWGTKEEYERGVAAKRFQE